MNICHATRTPDFFRKTIGIIIGFGVVAFILTAVANGQIDGFTEPFRSIDLSSDESGSIAQLHVVEGQQLSKNEVVARLDTRVQQLQLEIAQHLAESTSQLAAAEMTYKKRQAIYERVNQLRASGHASEGEALRAEMELSIAKAKYLAAKEEQVVRDVERRRAEAQLDRRTIKAPFAGVVAKIHRQEGEFLSPLRPEIVTLVQIDRLLATFNIPSSQLAQFEVGKEYNLELPGGKMVPAKVHTIGVETDAQSGTVQVKMVIENPSHQIRSGEICTLSI